MISRRDFIQSSSLAATGLFYAQHDFHRFLSHKNALTDYTLRYRQVHLDFHTSELIQDIASQFDPEEFASTLKKASVNSVTVFGRCHHGMIYFDTDKFPERKHPYLKRNLLKEQIDACHRLDIRTPIYTTIQWDHFTANAHPEWLCIDDTGKILGTEPFKAGFYRELDVASGYRDFLKAHLAELFEKVPVDGLFLDIVRPRESSSTHYKRSMLEKKLDPARADHSLQYATHVIEDFKKDMTDFIRKLDKKCSIFYNGGHVSPDIRNTLSTYSHLELESLPSGGWGYMHFPLTGRYARTLGTDLLGMTGKFHTSWGDFHSLKNTAALQFECFMMLALNAKCSIGDQLHPKGKLDKATYELISKVYGDVARKEPWCAGAAPVIEIGVFSPEASDPKAGRVPDAAMGIVRMLQESQHQFNIVDAESDLSQYKVLVLPDSITFTDKVKSAVESFIHKGGAVIASYKSGLNTSGTSFASDLFGAQYIGDAPYSPDFIECKGAIAKGLPETELVVYQKGVQIKTIDAQILAQATTPYFNRTYDHFVSHRHTPSTQSIGYPAIIQKGKLIYFIHPIFSQYADNASLWVKKLFLNALDSLLPKPLLKVEGPSTIFSAINEQSAQNRQIIHLLHYIAERRGRAFDVIEDIIPLYNLKVTLSTSKKIKSVRTVPEMQVLKYSQTADGLAFTLPKLEGHVMVEVGY